MVHGVVIPADSEQALVVREFTSLEDYQSAVGGWIEAVDLPGLGATVYVNEEGLLRQLPLNGRASFLWWYHVPAVRQNAMLVGDAVVIGLPDHSGNNTDLPLQVRDQLLTAVPHVIELRLNGQPGWHRTQAIYPDYLEAIVWAMVLLERIPEAVDVRVLPVDLDEIPISSKAPAAA